MTSTRRTIAALLIAVATLAGCAGAPKRTVSTPTSSAEAAAQSAAAQKAYDDAIAAVDASAAAAAAAVPSKDDYEISVKTLSKECFGSAGCNVDARLTVSGTPATNGVAVELTVKVTGGEDGAQIETISLDEDGQYSPVEVYLSTRSSKSKVKATITAVEVAD